MKFYLLSLLLISFNLFANELTLEKWNSLNRDQQADLISYNLYYEGSTLVSFSNLKHFKYSSDQAGVSAYSLITNPEHKAMGENHWELTKDNVYMSNEDSYYVEDSNIILVGGPYQRYFTIAYITIDGKDHYLGMYTQAFEIGCEMPVYPEVSFVKTEAEAKALGCEFSDISWTAYIYTDPSYNFIQMDDYMEWTGW